MTQCPRAEAPSVLDDQNHEARRDKTALALAGDGGLASREADLLLNVDKPPGADAALECVSWTQNQGSTFEALSGMR